MDMIKYLLDKGADPNSRGRFLRTPLYRAAFAGHLEATQVSVLITYPVNVHVNFTLKSVRLNNWCYTVFLVFVDSPTVWC